MVKRWGVKRGVKRRGVKRVVKRRGVRRVVKRRGVRRVVKRGGVNRFFTKKTNKHVNLRLYKPSTRKTIVKKRIIRISRPTKIIHKSINNGKYVNKFNNIYKTKNHTHNVNNSRSTVITKDDYNVSNVSKHYSVNKPVRIKNFYSKNSVNIHGYGQGDSYENGSDQEDDYEGGQGDSGD